MCREEEERNLTHPAVSSYCRVPQHLISGLSFQRDLWKRDLFVQPQIGVLTYSPKPQIGASTKPRNMLYSFVCVCIVWYVSVHVSLFQCLCQCMCICVCVCVLNYWVLSCSKASVSRASLARIAASSARAALGLSHMSLIVSEPAATRTTHSSDVNDTG